LIEAVNVAITLGRIKGSVCRENSASTITGDRFEISNEQSPARFYSLKSVGQA
jgi:hypothetical protein